VWGPDGCHRILTRPDLRATQRLYLYLYLYGSS
jgi:hypothetical protein